MFKEAIERELVYPTELKSKLLELGLKGVEITADELFYADDLSSKYRRLSVFDRIAIAIAKKRDIVLLTGDGALRNAAISENVKVMGTLGLLDKMLNEGCIDIKEYCDCLKDLKDKLGEGIRLPESEINYRFVISAMLLCIIGDYSIGISLRL